MNGLIVDSTWMQEQQKSRVKVHQVQHLSPWKCNYHIPWKTNENQVNIKWHSPRILFQSLITSLRITWDKGGTLELFTFCLPTWLWLPENKFWHDYSIPCSLHLQFHEGQNLKDSWWPVLADWNVTCHLWPVYFVQHGFQHSIIQFLTLLGHVLKLLWRAQWTKSTLSL